MPKSTKRSPAQRKAWSQLSPWIKRKIRKNPLSRWARRARREFAYTCTKCSKRKNLESHHWFPKAQFPLQKEDLDCAIILCRNCHDIVHGLLLTNAEAYINLYFELNKKRKPIKSIKNRNPSGLIYSLEIFENAFNLK